MPEKIKRIMNCVESRDKDRDWNYELGIEAGLFDKLKQDPGEKEFGSPDAASYDSDLRENWWKIGDQKSTGSCVGWATEAILRYHFAQMNNSSNNGDCEFSVRYLWMASKETDEFTSHATTFIEQAGTSLKAALDVARKYGIVKEGDLKFNGGLYTGRTESFYMKAARNKLLAYVNLGTNLWLWINWLKLRGPILTRLNVDDTWWNVGNDGNLATYKPPFYGGHAVCLVGFKEGRFIVRNSWGTNWGDKGFGHASISYAKAAFNEAYGVVAVMEF